MIKLPAVTVETDIEMVGDTVESTRSKSWSMGSATEASQTTAATEATTVPKSRSFLNSFYETTDVVFNPLKFALCLGMEIGFAGLTAAAAEHAFSEEMNALPSLPDALHKIGKCDQAGNDLHLENPGECTPTLSALFNTLPDRLAVLNLFAVTCLCLYAGIRTRQWRRVANLTGNYLALHATLMLLRMLTINATTLPAPSPLCRNTTYETLPTTGWFITGIVCNDSLFSGHTSVYVIIMVYMCCSFLHPVFKGLWVLVFLVSAFVSAVSADHYSIDVIVAVYVALPICLHRRKIITENMGPKAVCGFGVEDWVIDVWNSITVRFEY